MILKNTILKPTEIIVRRWDNNLTAKKRKFNQVTRASTIWQKSLKGGFEKRASPKKISSYTPQTAFDRASGT